MKRSATLFGVTATVIVLIVATAGPAMAQSDYKIDPVHSQVIFKAKHFGVSYNYGRFDKIEGSLKWDAAKPESSMIDVIVHADSVNTGVDKRDQHLRSNDFFNVKQFPVITFKSKSITAKGDNIYTVTGDLMLHGVTKSITTDFQLVGEKDTGNAGYRVGATATFMIKRSDFGMNFMIDNGVAGDEVTLMINIEAVRK